MYSFIDRRHGFCRRQLNGEGGPFTRLTVDGDPPIVSPYSFLDDGQAETRPATGLLGREERLENLCRVVGFDPMPRIGNFDREPAGLMQPATKGHGVDQCGAKAQGSSVGHRLERVLDQVVNGLLHVLTIGFYWWKIRGEFRYASDVLTFAFGPKQTCTFPHTIVDIDLRPYRGGPPRIQQQVLDDARSPLDLSFDCL